MDAKILQDHREDAATVTPPAGKSPSLSPALLLAHLLSLLAFPLILAVFWLTYAWDRPAYVWMLKEDRIVEWLSAVSFAAAALLAFLLVVRERSSPRWRTWILALFGVFCLLCALEEISWGQRVLGVQTPEFFQKYNDQREINIHNTLQKTAGVRLRIVFGWAFGLYGVVLPLLARLPAVAGILFRTGLRVPPLTLAPGFLAASLLVVLDRPTGGEEELGEFLFGLALFLFMFLEHLSLQSRQAAALPAGLSRGSLPRRWFLYGGVGLLFFILAALVTTFSTEGFLKRPYRLGHYLAARAAARDIPREGSLLTSPALLPLLGDRGDVVTWDSYRPGEDSPRFVFGSLTSRDRSRGPALLRMALQEGYGERLFDGDLFVLERGLTESLSPELRYVLERWADTVFLAWTAGDAREARFVRGGGIVRFWKGGSPDRPVTVSYGEPRDLDRGEYRVSLRYRVGGGAENQGGRLVLYRLDPGKEAAGVDLSAGAEGGEGFRTVTLPFTLGEPARVQTRVTGGGARLWLSWLVLEGPTRGEREAP